ncbi:MAG: helix-hairpin-helix domain-containing protein [Anaerolineae bacterium]|nr:helix-hairpin-helix domain-containing protein [Anaerolineae bacterium]
MDDYPQPPIRNLMFAFALLAIAIIGGGALLLATRPQPVQITINPPIPTATPAPTATPGPIEVYITGAVQQPQTTLTLPAGSRVEDAIDAAGGLLEDADLDRVNLALILRDGDQVHVPSLAGAEVMLATPNTPGLVLVNRAAAEELQTLPGVGPALAERIIAYREANGPFISLSDLDNVSGIGPALLERLQDLVAFD